MSNFRGLKNSKSKTRGNPRIVAYIKVRESLGLAKQRRSLEIFKPRQRKVTVGKINKKKADKEKKKDTVRSDNNTTNTKTDEPKEIRCSYCGKMNDAKRSECKYCGASLK